jgi:hypothetical protein
MSRRFIISRSFGGFLPRSPVSDQDMLMKLKKVTKHHLRGETRLASSMQECHVKKSTGNAVKRKSQNKRERLEAMRLRKVERASLSEATYSDQ